jgi:urease accessory protein
MDDQRVTTGSADSAPAGWLGQLALGFERRAGRTVLATRRHRGPFTVQRAFYPEEDYPHVYLLHPPGGVVGGDQLELSVNMGIGSHALLTMPGATKFYRSAGAQAHLTQRFILAENSILEWLPQGNIFFPGTKVVMASEFTLRPGARLLGFETLCFGRPVMDEGFELGQVNSLLRINLPHHPGLYERLRIDDGDLGKLANYPLNAIFFAAPASEAMLDAVRELLNEANSPAAGASLLDSLLVVRLLDNDNQRLQSLLQRFWLRLRPMMLGREAVIPRIWFT